MDLEEEMIDKVVVALPEDHKDQLLVPEKLSLLIDHQVALAVLLEES